MIFYILAGIILALDQLSKWMVVHNMIVGEDLPIIPHVFYLTSLRNTGAAWNILEGQFVFFFIITAIVLGIVIYYMQKVGRKQPLLGTALALIIGGTLGNFSDRLFRGEVVDFIHFYIIHYSYPVFNIADSSLFIGVVLIVIYLFVDGRKKN
ncbi:signal peptidase II [Sporolactobacillus putidus]|uniref:Lipoprotein signal peptidase n=1 Tax=Sporolactobacillus putidus TaxID=492735 RepID=A0A917RYI0_9BACL|nr:signal peptidase II [Sporolactobacillus putidus]GGL44631.1 lipoprotein signal peptidase [Sporolactobacillus putidus]